MVFSSAIFLFVFLPIVLGLYYCVSERFRNLILLLASLFFYTWGEPAFVLILLASITLDFFLAKRMAGQTAPHKKGILVFSLVVNVGLLAYFKYANFFVDNVQHICQWLGLTRLQWTNVALPIGISFVTFQKISYMIDVYRGDHEPQQRWDRLCLYILMFPQLIAGPIIRYKEIAEQLTDRFRYDTFAQRLNGFYRFLFGLSKKVLIANVLAEQVDVIFACTPTQLSASTAWLGMIAYSMQIYFDFSGYSDMALGLGAMFGFKFPENFNFPYLSKCFSEFWKRWHITLGQWMMDYLYIPLGGNRLGKKRMLFNLVVVFLLSGLWHGAAWTFVVWGLYHGLFLVLDKLGLKQALERVGSVPAMLITTLFVMIGWVIFRADTMTYAIGYIQRLFAFCPMVDQVVFNRRFFVVLCLSLLFAFSGVFPTISRIANNWFTHEHKPKYSIMLTIIALVLLVLNGSALLAGGFNPFIYFRF